MSNLTIKQENFVLKYLECGNASDAYRCAYDCDNMKSETINRKAKELLDNGNIAARIKELQSITVKKSNITKEKILAEYAKIAFTSIASMHNTWINRKDFKILSSDEKASIKSISSRIRRVVINDQDVDIEEIKIELYDKIKALDSISKMLGFNSPSELDITFKNPFEGLHPKDITKVLNANDTE